LWSVGHFNHVAVHERIKPPLFLGALASTRHHAKEFWKSVKVCMSSTQIFLGSLVSFIPVKSIYWITLSNLTQMVKSSFL